MYEEDMEKHHSRDTEVSYGVIGGLRDCNELVQASRHLPYITASQIEFPQGILPPQQHLSKEKGASVTNGFKRAINGRRRGLLSSSSKRSFLSPFCALDISDGVGAIRFFL